MKIKDMEHPIYLGYHTNAIGNIHLKEHLTFNIGSPITSKCNLEIWAQPYHMGPQEDFLKELFPNKTETKWVGQGYDGFKVDVSEITLDEVIGKLSRLEYKLIP